MKKISLSLLVTIGVIISGCASSPYTYHVKPTPLEKGVTKYEMQEVSVKLRLGHGAIPGDTSFASQEKLIQQFTDSLKALLGIMLMRK